MSKAKGVKIDFDKMPENTFPQRLEPGVHKVKFFGLEDAPTDDANYFVAVFKNKQGEHRDRLYITDSAKKYTYRKLFDWCRAAGIPEEDLKEVSDTDEVNDLLINKIFKIFIIGEEFENDKGEIKMNTKVPLWNSAEPVDGNSLRFDPNRHINRINTSNASSDDEGSVESTQSDTDSSEEENLPF